MIAKIYKIFGPFFISYSSNPMIITLKFAFQQNKMLKLQLKPIREDDNFDFKSMFSRLKNKLSGTDRQVSSIFQMENHNKKLYRPKSVDIKRASQPQQNKPMFRTLNGKKDWYYRSTQSRRCITESNSHKSINDCAKNMKTKGVQFLQTGYNCLKKIELVQQNFEGRNNLGLKKIQISDEFVHKNALNPYKAKNLKAFKRRQNFGGCYKDKDISVRIQGRKII